VCLCLSQNEDWSEKLLIHVWWSLQICEMMRRSLTITNPEYVVSEMDIEFRADLDSAAHKSMPSFCVIHMPANTGSLPKNASIEMVSALNSFLLESLRLSCTCSVHSF
jgi:hypothetical protein